MRTEIIQTYKTVHTWTGILAGMALFIAFYAGGLTLFQDAVSRWATPPAAEMEGVPLSQAAQLIARTLASHPEAAKDFSLRLSPPGVELVWRVGADEHDAASGIQYAASLDAHGALRVKAGRRPQIGTFINALHRVVGLPVDNGTTRIFMGVVVILYVLALVSGLVMVLPTMARDFFAFRVGARPRRLWTDAHRVLGLASLPFHLMIALTAVVFAFNGSIYAAQDRMIHGGKLASVWAQPTLHQRPSAPLQPQAMLSPQELLAQAKALAPRFEPASLHYSRLSTPRASVQVWGHNPTALSPRAAGGFVALDPYSGHVLNADYLPGCQDLPHAILSIGFASHFGAYGGQPVRWIYFLLALSGAWLFYSGNLLWIESRRKGLGKEGLPQPQRRAVRVMAALSVGVCLGCVCGISLSIASAKWLGGHPLALGAWHRGIYYTAWCASILWALHRGAARSSVTLLRAAAVLTLAIPATSLLAWALPGLGLWVYRETLGVDITALLAALVFVGMSRSVSRRVRLGPSDSVWSAKPLCPDHP